VISSGQFNKKPFDCQQLKECNYLVSLTNHPHNPLINAKLELNIMIFIIVFAALTTIVLLLGLLSMAAGEKFSKKYGTKLMSLRIAMQSIAILSLVCAYFLWSN